MGKYKAGEIFGGMVIGVIIAFIVIAMPLLTIWSINTLFGVGILYTIKTWLAVFVLLGILSSFFKPINKVKK